MPIVAYTRLHPLVGKSYRRPIAVTQIRADLRRSLVPRLSTQLHRKYQGEGRQERKRAWYELFAHA